MTEKEFNLHQEIFLVSSNIWTIQQISVVEQALLQINIKNISSQTQYDNHLNCVQTDD